MCVQAEPDVERSRLPGARGTGPTRHRQGRPLPANANHDRQLPANRRALQYTVEDSNGAPGFYDQWNYGFNLNWELDFWGRFRRAVIAAEDSLQASAYGYDAVLVTLLGDMAQNYVRLRTDQERIKLLQANAELQRGI